MSLESKWAILSAYVTDRGSCTSNSALGDYVYDFDPLGFESYVNDTNKKVEVWDPLEEVYIGFDNVERLTYISWNLPKELREWLVKLLKDYR